MKSQTKNALFAWGKQGLLVSVLGLGLVVPTVVLATEVTTDQRPVTYKQEVFEGQTSLLSMGTLINVRIQAHDQAQVSALLDRFISRVDHYNTLLTVHQDGPLNMVNQKAGQWVEVPCEVVQLVQTAQSVAKESDRAFEPTIGPLVNVWKIGFGGQVVPAEEDIQEALKKVDYQKIQTEVTPGACRIRIESGQFLDLGAIAKGWIGTQLAEELRDQSVSYAMVDLGGNIALVNAPLGRQASKIGIQNPDSQRGGAFAYVLARDESVITSGAYERKMQIGEKTYGHILSAVTGHPVTTDLSSVSVIDKDGAIADAWCTAFFAMGLDKTIEYVQKHPKMKVILLDAKLQTVYVSDSVKDRFFLLDEAMTVKPISQSH